MQNNIIDIKKIQDAFIKKDFRYTKHGVEQRIKRQITEEEIEEAVLSGKIIENYPLDKYGPSCLVFGKTKKNRPLHIQVALYPMISIVTIYEPDAEKWVDYIIRR